MKLSNYLVWTDWALSTRAFFSLYDYDKNKSLCDVASVYV